MNSQLFGTYHISCTANLMKSDGAGSFLGPWCNGILSHPQPKDGAKKKLQEFSPRPRDYRPRDYRADGKEPLQECSVSARPSLMSMMLDGFLVEEQKARALGLQIRQRLEPRAGAEPLG